MFLFLHYSYQNRLFLLFLIYAIISHVRWYLVIILICIYLVNDDKYFFIFLVVILYPLQKRVCSSLPSYCRVICFVVTELCEYFIYLGIRHLSLSYVWCTNTFGSHSTVLRDYSRLCTQESLLLDSGCQGSNWISHIQSKQIPYPLYCCSSLSL